MSRLRSSLTALLISGALAIPAVPLARDAGGDERDTEASRSPPPDQGAREILRPLFLDRLASIASGPRTPGEDAWVVKADLVPGAGDRPSVLGGSVPLMLETRFNAVAAAHIARGLPDLRATASAPDDPVSGRHGLRALPPGARVTLTAWWPVAAHVPTPLPVWTDDLRARPGGSNGFLSWPRLFRLSTTPVATAPRTLPFAGRYRETQRDVSLSAFAYQTLSDAGAARWMARPAARKLARMVLGRDLTGGDRVALVAMHLLCGDGGAGLWGTIWWGDARSGGTALGAADNALSYRFAATRGAALEGAAESGAARIFNPWLEGGLPDSGEGAGVDSDCVSCHRRAAIPARDFLRVTGGLEGPEPGSVATAMLWSLAIAQQRNTD